MSRVECMLKLPSLDLVFSSNRGERENPAGAHPTDGSHPASSTPPGQHIPKTLPTKGLQNCAVHAKILTMQLCSLSKLKHVLTSILNNLTVPSYASFQHRLCWGAPSAGAATAAASLTSRAPPAPPQASASQPACQTSPSMFFTHTVLGNRSLQSQASLRALGR